MKNLQFNNLHNKKIHHVESLSIEDINHIINMLNDKQCNLFPLIKIKERIGSESLHATVWKIEINGKYLALKVQSNDEKSLNEIEINSYLNNWPSYFINYYGNLYCENININKQIFSGYFLFMELAIGDLAQYLIYQNNVSEKECIQFVLDVFEGIYILGKNQIYHGDLHIRNIFIVMRDNLRKADLRKAVIGDFGESKGIDSITSHTSDIYKFCTSLLEFLNSYSQFNKWIKIKKLLREIINYVNKRNIIIEKNYETETINKYENLEELDQYFEKIVGETVKQIRLIISKYF
jgi:serine/threonine protein kinase